MHDIGGYKVIRLLGKGGMSEVYEVENERLGSRHALKLFTYEKDDVEVRERFLTEGKLLARLNHPRIVRVTDFGTDESSGKPYFVMDLILDQHGQTRSLADVEPGTADEEEVGRWYDDLREGLSYIHANGVIHRDLKLQNVLIGPDGHVVLTDFGISRVLDSKGTAIVDTIDTIVKMRDGRSLVMGSIGYMAPELEMGVAASPQSDWYALGVVVYRLLTGSWCDARTDLRANLEGFDSAWEIIIPKLLHANPQGRECLSFVEEQNRIRERERFILEDGALAMRSHLRWWRLTAGMTLSFAVVLGVSLFVSGQRHQRVLVETEFRMKDLLRQAEVPSFSEACRLLEPTKINLKDGRAARTRRWLAQIDAWVLAHDIFDDLKAKRITMDKAIADLESLVKRVEGHDLNLFSDFDGYVSRGSSKDLSQILRNCAEVLKKCQK